MPATRHQLDESIEDEGFEPAGLDSPADEELGQAPPHANGQTKSGRGKSTRAKKGAQATAAAGVTTRDSTAAASVVKIPLEKLHQHPQNPEPPESDIIDTMAWLSSQQQLEPLIVRPLADPIGHFQVLAGKRRCLAAARLGWSEMECRVRDDLAGDEKNAVLLMGASNAQRHVETPIRQALMMQAAIAAGATHEEAGAVYGLESKSGVVNKLRLLQLPEVWHARLASAEISERVARQFVPYVVSDRIMKAIEKEWRDDQKFGGWRRDRWAERPQDVIESIVERHVRPIDKKQKHNYGWPLGAHPRYFDLTPEIEVKLEIIELPLGKNGAAVKVATNTTEWEKLQKPLLDAKQKAKERGAKPKPEKGDKPLTPAELKAKRKAADEQTAKRVHEWRHRFLRFAAAGQVQAGDWKTGLLSPWLMQATAPGYGGAPIDQFFEDALVMMNATNARGREWRGDAAVRGLTFSTVITAIDADGDPVREVEETHMLLCKWLLWPATNIEAMAERLDVVDCEGEAAERLPPLDDDDVEAICRFLGVDMKNAWDNLAHRDAFGAHFIEQFFALHTKDQLADLVEELKIDDLDCKTKGDLVAAFVSQHVTKSPLKMPKSIAPLAAAAGKTKKRGKR